MKKTYVVEFAYYHHNTGRADNGIVHGHVAAMSLEDARLIRDKINAWVPKADTMNINSPDWDEYNELCDYLFDGGGHLIPNHPAHIIEIQEQIVE